MPLPQIAEQDELLAEVGMLALSCRPCVHLYVTCNAVGILVVIVTL